MLTPTKSLRANNSRRTNRTQREQWVRLSQAQDEERRRIARELHDSTGQELAILAINLGTLRSKTQHVDQEVSQLAADCEELARQISAELRTISYLLHPPMLDLMGLAPALHWFIDAFRSKSNIHVTLELPANLGRLPVELE